MPIEPRNVRGIVFDLDGTLIDSYDAIAESLNEAMARMSRDTLPAERVRKMVGRGLETLIDRALGGGASAEEIARGVRLFRETYDRICVARTRLLPGVGPTLRTLRSRGYRMCVATNKPSYFARRLLDALDVGGDFDVVLGPDVVAHPKPHPGMVLAALAVMATTPEQALYVGDMELDVQTARAARIAVVVLPTGSCDLETLRAAGADLVLERFDALLDLLAGPLLESPQTRSGVSG